MNGTAARLDLGDAPGTVRLAASSKSILGGISPAPAWIDELSAAALNINARFLH